MVAHISDRYRSTLAALTKPQRDRWRRYPPRVDGRSAQAKQIKQKLAFYTAQLGGYVTEQRRRDLTELAETETLLDLLRAAALNGDRVDLTALNRLINTKNRLRSFLGLTTPPCDAVPTIDEVLAQADGDAV